MAVRSCLYSLRCPGSDFPITNYSAEAIEDEGIYTSVVFPDEWDKLGCISLCVSSVSQEEADLCALAQEAQCANGGGDGTGGDGGTNEGDENGGPFPPPPPTVVQRYFNSAQTCSVACPDGTLFYYTVPAYTFSNWTLDAANAQAYALACKLAKANKICLSDIESCACEDAAYSAEITCGSARTLTWSVISGALPYGLSLSDTVTTTGSVYLIGTPTTTGEFTFTLMALASNGSYMTKEYTLNILAIVDTAMDEFTVGDPYVWTFQGTGGAGTPYYRFTIVDGSLPAGLTMDEYGRITGTPTEGGDHTFTVEMEDIETCP